MLTIALSRIVINKVNLIYITAEVTEPHIFLWIIFGMSVYFLWVYHTTNRNRIFFDLINVAKYSYNEKKTKWMEKVAWKKAGLESSTSIKRDCVSKRVCEFTYDGIDIVSGEELHDLSVEVTIPWIMVLLYAVKTLIFTITKNPILVMNVLPYAYYGYVSYLYLRYLAIL